MHRANASSVERITIRVLQGLSARSDGEPPGSGSCAGQRGDLCNLIQHDAAEPTLSVNKHAACMDSDAMLIERVRLGDGSAFDVLYRRHVAVAERWAAGQVDNPSDIEDVVAESFSAVLQHLLGRKGPDAFFRAYLFAVVRRNAHTQNRFASRTLATSEVQVLDWEVRDPDTVMEQFESSALAKAFQSLPTRWQNAIWYVDVEGLKPAAVSGILELSPNAVSTLVLRAREGLRTAYLQAHVGATIATACGIFTKRLGAYARNALKRTAQDQMRSHLETCSRCTAILLELLDVRSLADGKYACCSPKQLRSGDDFRKHARR